jgi:hypothetical protein
MMRRVPVPPIHLSPEVTALLLLLAVLLLLSVAAWATLEIVFGHTAGLALRVTGHPKPRKSAARTAIDQLEARLRRRQ